MKRLVLAALAIAALATTAHAASPAVCVKLKQRASGGVTISGLP